MNTKLLFPFFFAFVACATTVTLDDRATQLTARAAEAEPAVTTMLVALAEQLGGEMYKLEYRLKSFDSTRRKLNKKLQHDPSRSIAELELDDTLRYTMRFEDQPPGHYVLSVQEVLTELEKHGHDVVRLKNYWPPDDNYSGVNGVLRAPSGLTWELQFHTAKSLEVQSETRDMYEELRKIGTPIERKRALFDAMTEAWSKVPIPERVLVPASLHATEEIRERPRP